MNKRDWFYKQLVSQADMDEAFDWVESSMWELAVDNRMWGIHDGLSVAENAPPDLTVLIDAGSATGKDGDRVYTATASTLLDCSMDEYGVSTAVAGAGNARVLSVFARFVRNATDPEVDGNGLTVYTRQLESIEFFVRQGAEAASGSEVPPAVLPEAILLADITLLFGQVTIQNTDMDVSRREDWLRYLGATFSLVAGTPHGAMIQAVADGLVEAFDKHVSDTAYPHGGGGVAFTFTDTWFGAVPVAGSTPPPATVAAALDAIVYDLAQAGAGPSGSDYIGTTDSGVFPGGFVTPWVSANLQAVLMSLGADLDAHIGGAPPQHPASSITFSTYSWLTSATVQAALQEVVDDLANATATGGASRIGNDAYSWISSTTLRLQIREIVDDLANTGAGTAGDMRVGVQAIAGSPESFAGGTLAAVLLAVYGHLNARTERASDETITGDWTFTGDVTVDGSAGTTVFDKSRFGGGIAPDAILDDVCARKTWGTRKTWAHMWVDANIHGCASAPSDICCAVEGHDVFVLAMVPGNVTVEIVKARSITTTDVADISVAGAPTPTAICCDGPTVFVMYDNDTVSAWSFSSTPGGGAWAPKWGPVALPAGASGSHDRIMVVDDTSIMTANSGLATNTGNSFTKMNRADGAGVASGIGSAVSSASNYPAGGICSCGTTWYATTMSGANADLVEIDPATMGDPGQFISGNPSRGGAAETWRDIVCDGAFVWIVDYLTAPGRAHVYPVEQDSSNTNYDAYVWGASHYSRRIVFDGFNVWMSNHTTGVAPNGIELQGVPVCRENWAPPGTTGINAQVTAPWANVITPNPGKMTFDGDAVWCIQDEGTNYICRLPHATDRC